MTTRRIKRKLEPIEVKRLEHPPVRLNRSRNWKSATTYKQARELSPWPERPVR